MMTALNRNLPVNIQCLETEEFRPPKQADFNEPDSVVYLSQAAYDVIVDHVYSEPNLEVIGFLLGTIQAPGTAPVEVMVEQALVGEEVRSTRSSVQLSYASWKYFLEEKRSRYAHLATVGWYHSHPGFGTFLSGMDKLIHQSFFGKPWQVALVIDPIHSRWTFFRNGPHDIERCRRFYLSVTDEYGSPGFLQGNSPSTFANPR